MVTKCCLVALLCISAASARDHHPVYHLDSNLEGEMTWYAHAKATVTDGRPRFASQRTEYPVFDDRSPFLRRGFKTWSSEAGTVRFKNVDKSVADVVCVESEKPKLQKEALAIQYKCSRTGGKTEQRFMRGPWSDGGSYGPGSYWNGGEGTPSPGNAMYGWMGQW